MTFPWLFPCIPWPNFKFSLTKRWNTNRALMQLTADHLAGIHPQLYVSDSHRLINYFQLSLTFFLDFSEFLDSSLTFKLCLDFMTGFLSLCSSFPYAKFPQEVYCTIESWGDTHKRSVCLKSINGLLNH